MAPLVVDGPLTAALTTVPTVVRAYFQQRFAAVNAKAFEADVRAALPDPPSDSAVRTHLRILEEKGVTVIPDILANAGGVTVSYFEWVQDRIGYFWDQNEVDTKMEGIMVGAFNDVVKMAEGFEVSYRIAAYMLAIERVSQMARLRGVYA